MKCCFENDCLSPVPIAIGSSGNPFEKNGYFFLYQRSDQRKLLLVLRKKAVLAKKYFTKTFIFIGFQ
jgi:hypothetical protein